MKNENKSRRRFLFYSALAGMLFALPPRVRAFVVDSFPVRTVEIGEFRFEAKSGVIKWKDRDERYELTVLGLVEKPSSFTYKDLRALPRIMQTSDFHCVEGWDVPDVKWGGFRFREIVDRVRPKPEAKYAVFHSLGKTGDLPGGLTHYVESHPVAYLTDPSKQCLMALDLDGKPLPFDHGSPLRVVAPLSLGYKSIKFVTRIEFTSKPQDGWWTVANPVYKVDAPVPEGRLRRK